MSEEKIPEFKKEEINHPEREAENVPALAQVQPEKKKQGFWSEDAPVPKIPQMPEGRDEKIKFLEEEIESAMEAQEHIKTTRAAWHMTKEELAGEDARLASEDVEGMQVLLAQLKQQKKEERQKNNKNILRKIGAVLHIFP